MEIGNKIKELRQTKGISQAKLAKAIGYGQTVVCFWESGERKPASDAIIALALFFDVSSDYLLGLENEDGSRVRVSNSFNNSGTIGNGNNINFGGNHNKN
jgi:transcriptional regulator with XRE-family HTH domain